MMIVLGAHPTDAHPVFASRMKKRLREGAKLIVIDPRRIDLVRMPHVEAAYHLPLLPGKRHTAILSALAHVIVTEGLVNEAFVRERCDWDKFRIGRRLFPRRVTARKRWRSEKVTEVESGKRSDRPKLAEALKACRLQGAKLIIAKLDRLARNVAFISNLMESKVEFEAVDFPQANRLTIHIMAAIAEHEAKMISDRTRAALAAAKARGKRLGGFRGRAGTAADCAKARQAKSLAAKSRAADLAPVIEDIRTAGANSLRSIAKELNERGISAHGGVGQPAQVRAAIARMPG